MSTYPELCRSLASQDGKGKDSIAAVEDLQRQDRLLLPLFNGNKDKHKNCAEGKQRKNDWVGPGELDTPELDRQEQSQNRQSKQDGALEVDALEFALLAARIAVGRICNLRVGRRAGEIDDDQHDGEDDWRDLAVERPNLVSVVNAFLENLHNSPPPSDDIDEPATQGTADTSAKGGNQVDIGTPLGHVSDGQQVCMKVSFSSYSSLFLTDP